MGGTQSSTCGMGDSQSASCSSCACDRLRLSSSIKDGWQAARSSPPSKVPATSGDRSQGDGQELVVVSERHADSTSLGVRLLTAGIGVLVVCEILEHGSVYAENRRSVAGGEASLEVGDQIVFVNGVGGDDVAMLEECRRSLRLVLGVHRPDMAVEMPLAVAEQANTAIREDHTDAKQRGV
mmetsp:Transcript_29752/g.81523  ORF Transcript_29752/g.81523 Transcript_29752/m.81523 type:complete len:181 (-) Transcript_29752:12-554(-)